MVTASKKMLRKKQTGLSDAVLAQQEWDKEEDTIVFCVNWDGICFQPLLFSPLAVFVTYCAQNIWAIGRFIASH